MTLTVVRAGLVATMLCAASLPATAANLLKDGGFEKPVVPVGSYTLFWNGQPFGPWSVVGDPGNVAVISGSFQLNGFTFSAKGGAQWLDLTGAGSNSPTGVQQTVATTPGAEYTLTFFVGNIYNPGGEDGTTSTVNVSVDGSPLMSATNSGGKGKTTQVWKKFSSTITASGASTTVTFINGDPSGDNNCGLDSVSLVPVVVATTPNSVTTEGVQQ